MAKLITKSVGIFEENIFEQCSKICNILTMSSNSTASSAPRSRKNPGRDLALIAVFAAFIAVCALLPAFPVGPAGVPITFQTLGIYLTALVLGGGRGFLSTLLYVVIGLIGLPVFAGGGAGIGVLASPSAGYLLGFLPCAFVIGVLAHSFLRRRSGNTQLFIKLFLATLAGSVLLTTAGIIGMVVNAHLSWGHAFAAALIYLPGDLIKCMVSAAVALAVHRAFPALARRS